MLFNSYQFIFVFLPIAFIGFFWIAGNSHRLAALWLAAASLFFYGWWNPKFVLLLLASIAFNYAMGYAIGHSRVSNDKLGLKSREGPRPKPLMILAVVANLALLGYFKYMNFFISTANHLAGTGWSSADIVLPLGISFFTFTQIAFLVDTYRGIAREYNFIHYLLFVSYFPHLIAGPILHHKQMMPQFADPTTYRVNAGNVATGLVFFAIGLAKKVILADSFAEYASPIFNATSTGGHPGFFVAWIGALAYTFQLYFDFSGYSDMAIGLSRLFNVQLPFNFNSPYKAHNIIDFWRRWHMTLSQFLRDYLYISLGGNRQGTLRRYFNLMITMLLGGLWHGASWTFVAWGGLHGLYLVANHGWHALLRGLGIKKIDSPIGRLFGIVLTFTATVVAWVFFRADTFDGAIRILNGMHHFHDMAQIFSGMPSFENMFLGYVVPPDSYPYLISLLGIGLSLAWLAPNTQTLVEKIGFETEARQFLTIGALGFWILMLAAISGSRGTSEFIYFNF